MICCSENRETPYCPMCGTSLRKADLSGLLRHVKSQVQRNESHCVRWRNSLSGKRTTYKWRCWSNGLEAMMARDAVRPAEPPQ